MFLNFNIQTFLLITKSANKDYLYASQLQNFLQNKVGQTKYSKTKVFKIKH